MSRRLVLTVLLAGSCAWANHHLERLSLMADARTGGAMASTWQHFGAEFTVAKAMSADDVAAHWTEYVGKTVRLEARVADACQKKGCWMVVLIGDKSLRVTMKDYGFFVPTDSKGALADLEGSLVEKAADPKAEEHYASESTEPGHLPQTHDGKTYEFVATGIGLKK